MTRDEMNDACISALGKSNCLLLEAATGTGKSRQSILLVNWIAGHRCKSRRPRMLLLVAKRVHKQTWKEEFNKWGGVSADVTMECYESLRKHIGEQFDIVVLDECHHIGSQMRMDALKTIRCSYVIGLSATIPRNIKAFFRFNYHAETVSCNIIDAIDSEILPEPAILLFPLQVENTKFSETIELNARQKGPVVYGEYRDLWKYKKSRQHAILRCTQRQKLNELNSLIEWEKKKYMQTRHEGIKQSWLFHSGKRLEFLADCKLPMIRLILDRLKQERTITFCKTIPQAETVGHWCIHSKNSDATKFYEDFNKKKIDHITAVNILNENANLVDCRYAIFCNLSSSDVVIPQRIGRSLRHKKPVIIIPYYEGTREEEIIASMLIGNGWKDALSKSHLQFLDPQTFLFKKTRVIHSISEL